MLAIINLFIAIIMAVIAVGQWEEGRYRYMAVSLVLCASNFWLYASSINS